VTFMVDLAYAMGPSPAGGNGGGIMSILP